MINVTICCDELDQVSTLNSYLVKFSSFHDFKYKLSKFESFNELVNKPPKHIDILLLNINLTNKQTVFKTYEKIKSLYSDIQIVFMPEIVDFMLNGFSLKDFKYILKPLKYSAFEDELLLCIRDLDDENKPIKKMHIHKNYINILGGVSTKSILFIESRCNNCIAYTSNNFVTIPHNIDMLEKNLNPSDFFRCHNNHLINLKKIRKLNRTSVIINSKVVPVSENKFKELKNRLLFMLKII
ncbi:LytTR family DNA-binding domain-containing protein [Romboutsia sp.]|uniref:LytR/AlgR family response regulator transcription factor n=1 Tax=Romboutsia sp. TaxID=1965302 RepID=UPI002CFB5803|nr:LytTR family DNA-binding domain-containing protein [Romboutsia sp.]HSQ88018.1 LytTR family DNA-binding domain-containing protein [Romboutsia sp.]